MQNFQNGTNQLPLTQGRTNFSGPAPSLSKTVSHDQSRPSNTFSTHSSNTNVFPTEQAKARAHSPLKVTPKIEGSGPSGLHSSMSGTQPRRPLSQLPQARSVQGNWNESGSISNYDRKGISPNLGGRPFGRLDKEGLRDQISSRNKNVKELTNNRKFFEEILEKQNVEFKEQIRQELKGRIFDKVLKSNLHYIYKHYENLKSRVDRAEALRILNTNVVKQNAEVADGRKALGELDRGNRALEQNLLESANKVGLLRAAPELVENVSKEDVERKVKEIGAENQDLERSVADLKKWKDGQLYDLKFKHEIKGRQLMEEKSIRLALKYVDPQDPEQTQLKHQVEVLLKEVELKTQTKKSNVYYQLQAKRDKLKKELELLKFSKA